MYLVNLSLKVKVKFNIDQYMDQIYGPMNLDNNKKLFSLGYALRFKRLKNSEQILKLSPRI